MIKCSLASAGLPSGLAPRLTRKQNVQAPSTPQQSKHMEGLLRDGDGLVPSAPHHTTNAGGSLAQR